MEIEEYCKTLKDEGHTYANICRLLSYEHNITRSEDQVRYIVSRKDKPRLSVKDKLSLNEQEKVLVLCDLHIPFNLDILSIVEKHKDEISTIIIGGDLVDCAEISKFVSLGKCTLEEEKIKSHQLLVEIDKICPDIPKVLITGNHETRWGRYLARNGGVLTNFHSGNILKEICDGFTVYDHNKNTSTVYGKLSSYHVVEDWFFQYGDMIVCHPISFSSIEGRTGVMAVDYFVKQGYDFSSCLVAHTHKQATGWRFGKFFAETGCLCFEQDYSNSGNLKYAPCQQGYGLITFTNDKYDHNESRIYSIDG